MARKKRSKKTPLTTPLTTRYRSCRKAELARFATDRGLRVVSTSGDPRKRPSQDDYVRALKQADADVSFRFLDLPPEMRNMVYKELVVLQDSWSCHPQILSTSKQVNRKATSILYGDNLIEVKIYEDGVMAHGKRCGPYTPAAVGDLGDFRKLVWPDFLYRVQHLRIAVVELPPLLARMASFGNILASLCSFLALDNRLFSLTLDLEWLPLHAVRDGVEMALYPLRLLGPAPQLSIRGFQDLAAPLMADMSQATAEPAPRTSCSVAVLQILNNDQMCMDPERLGNPPMSNSEIMRWDFLWAIGRGLLSHGLNHGPTWENEVLKYVDCVRVRYERAGPGGMDQTLRTKLEELLRAGVDVRKRQAIDARQSEV